MAITPLDISNKEFRKRPFGGYDPKDVNEFLDILIQEFDKTLHELQKAQQTAQALEGQLEQYRTLEETMSRTLIAAQESADDLRANARKEAELIVQEAQLQAEKLVNAGREQAARVLAENADLQRAIDALRVQIRSQLQAQLEALDRIAGAPTVLERLSDPEPPSEP